VKKRGNAAPAPSAPLLLALMYFGVGYFCVIRSVFRWFRCFSIDIYIRTHYHFSTFFWALANGYPSAKFPPSSQQETIRRANFFARNPFVCLLEPKTCQNVFGILPRFFENLLMSENSGVSAEGWDKTRTGYLPTVDLLQPFKYRNSRGIVFLVRTSSSHTELVDR